MKYAIPIIVLFLTVKTSIGQELSRAYPSSWLVEFRVETKGHFEYGKPIEIDLIWENKSSQTEKIMIHRIMGYPIGVTGIIADRKGNDYQYGSTRHVLWSGFIFPEDNIEHEIELKPNEVWIEKVDFRSIPYFKSPYGFEENIPPGAYYIQVGYYLQNSKIIEIVLE